MYLILFYLFTILIPYYVLCEYVTVEEVKRIFSSQNCIEGSFSNFFVKPQETLLLKEAHYADIRRGNVSSVDRKSEKSVMSKLHELAQYNEIDYFYKLEKEEGPPHNKFFTVSLTLGDEEFKGSGNSLKKAQYDAASSALQNTDYALPLFKETIENQDVLKPTVLLNNLSSQLGVKVTYYLVNKEKEGILSSNFDIDEKSGKSYLQKLNESIYADDLHIRRDEPQTKGPFKVVVEVADKYFYGISYTVQSARHEAATKAVDHLIKQVEEKKSACVVEGSEEQCKQAKANIKSPISQVYEAAKLRDLSIEFEIIKESGPPHRKRFVNECRLGALTTIGEGKSKKESKRAAAINMLERLVEVPEASQEVQVRKILNDSKNKQKSKQKRKKKVLKTKFDMINMHINNIVDSIIDFRSLSTPEVNSATNNHKKRKSSKTVKQKPSRKSFQDEILEVSNSLNFEVQFMDINDKDKYFTLMSIHINPQYICLGHGLSIKLARDVAAKEGLKLLQNIYFADNFVNKKYTLIESEIWERIHSLLNKDMLDSQLETE